MTRWTRLPERAVLAVAGSEAEKLLQGLVSVDLARLEREPAVYGALLSPQGKCLFDFLIARDGARLIFDVEAARLDDLVRRLTLYRLRADVSFTPEPDLAVHAVYDGDAPAVTGAVIDVVDPRLAALGRRVIGVPDTVEMVLAGVAQAATPADYAHHRLTLGVPEGSGDLEVDKALLLESGFVELGGVDFDKGCFVGQELTARMRYRATVRKRLLPVCIDGTAVPETPITDGEIEVGTLRSVAGNVGLALIRLDRWQKARDAGQPLQAGEATVAPWVPDWVDLSFASKVAESSA